MTDTREVARRIWERLTHPKSGVVIVSPLSADQIQALIAAELDKEQASSTGDLVEALRPYIQHLSWCHKTRSIVHPCDCGLEAALLAAQCSKQKPLFQPGQVVRVNHERYHGTGIVQYDSGERARVVGVLLENGNTWEYEVETVELAAQEKKA